MEETLPKVELQQFHFDLDGVDVRLLLYGLRLALMIANQLNNDVENALNNYTEYLLNTISSPAACFPLSSSPSSCFTSRATSPPSFTLAFQPGERDDFLTTLRHSPFTSNSHLEFSSPLSNIQAQSEEMVDLSRRFRRGTLWLPTAVSTLFNRLRTLFFRASPLDIALITAGYLLMHSTFFRLLLSARALGSHFWLTAAILTSSTLGFVLALPLAMLIGIPVDPVLLTEALPFLVCTVGFDKPLRFGRAVFPARILVRSFDAILEALHSPFVILTIILFAKATAANASRSDAPAGSSRPLWKCAAPRFRARDCRANCWRELQGRRT